MHIKYAKIMWTNGKIQLYPLIRIAIMLSIGIATGYYLYNFIPITIWLGLTIISIIGTILLKDERLQSGSIMISTLLIGATLSAIQWRKINNPLPNGYNYYEGLITTTPKRHKKVIMCDLMIQKQNNHVLKKTIKTKAAILIDHSQKMNLSIGDGIVAYTRLEPPANFHNSNFDYAKWLKMHGYQAQTFIPYWQMHTAKFKLHISKMEYIKLQMMKFRQKIIDICRQKGFRNDNLAILAAMTLGDKSLLSKNIKNDFSVAGDSHILALSGLHIGIIFMILVIILGKNWLSTSISLICIWAFTILVGISPSVTRAATMITIYSLMSLSGRKKMSINTLALAAIIILAINPMSLWDVGFQLSFCAVLAIMLLYNPILHLWNIHIQPLRWIWESISISIAAQAGTFILILYYFHTFSCYFILTNLIVIPCATILLYLALAMMATLPLPSIQGVIITCMLKVTGVMIYVTHWVAMLPGSSIVF